MYIILPLLRCSYVVLIAHSNTIDTQYLVDLPAARMYVASTNERNELMKYN